MIRGTYLRDGAGRLYCRHGLILYGDACVQCERDALTSAGLAAQLRWADAKPFESRIRGRSAERIIIDDPWAEGGPDPKDLADATAFFAEALKRRGGTWQDTATRNPSEIITDPADRRGFDAKPIRRAS